MIDVNDATFENEVLKNEAPTLVDFWAPWCGPCRMIHPIMEELAAEFTGKVKVVKMNVDESPSIPTRYGIRGIPTVILFKAGQEVDKIVGAVTKNKFSEMINKHL